MENNNHNTHSVSGRVNDPATFARFASVKSYQDHLKDKDNPVVMVTLTLGGKDFLDRATFETYLTQHTNAHDEFTIVVSDTAIDDFNGQVMKNSKNLLGESITIHFHLKGTIVQSFKGIIANICNKKNEGGGYGSLHISGFAPSILLDSGKECQSYENKTLKEIVAEATKEYSNITINTEGMVNTKYQIPYVVQYKESDYQFIQRLARRYGEFFYYNGTQLQFNNETQKTVTLLEGGDLIDVEFELMLKPQHFSYLSYDVATGNMEQKATEEVRLQNKVNPFQFAAIKASEKVFTKKPTVPYNAIPEDFRGDYLKDAVRREKESREQLMQVRGRSRNPHLRIGGFVKLRDINDKPMETYRIIDIKHHQSGYDYENEFVAIPDVYIAYYYDEQALPKAEQQLARVIDNNDPKGLGRVRVQFIWQEKHQTKTPWIRVVQPHAGGGKGFYFIPEIGEEVWVDFEDHNAERPYVLGSNYNGKEYSPFHNKNNDIKAIQTRSGHKLIFTEDESILLSDKNGNTLKFDTQGKNIEISAPESISLCAGKDLNISAGNNLTMDVANTAFFNVLQQMFVTTPFMKQLITDYFHTQAGKALINSDQEIKIEARETNVAGTEKLLVHSDRSATLNSKGVLSVKGEQGNKYNNKADSYNITTKEIKVKCVVHFRPKKDWKGEGYGFDWMRERHLGDEVSYSTIVRKQYKKNQSQDNENLEKDYNKYDGDFGADDDQASIAMFNKLKREYGVYRLPWKPSPLEGTVMEYYSSWLCTYPDTPCTLTLLLELEDTSIDKIYLKPDRGVKVTPEVIDVTSFQEANDGFPYKKLTDGIVITVTGVGKNTQERLRSLKSNKKIVAQVEVRGLRYEVGALNIWHNAPEFQKTASVTLVMVSTQTVNKEELKQAKDKAVKCFEKYLPQALVQVKVRVDVLDLSSDKEFAQKYMKDRLIRAYYEKPKEQPEGYKEVVSYLKDKYRKSEKFYQECYVAFYFYQNDGGNVRIEAGVEKIEPLGGYDSLMGAIVLFPMSTYDSTPTHELCHLIGLSHSFANEEANTNNVKNKYTFEYAKTNNIMDYDTISFSLWKWQWEFIQSKIK